MFNQSVISVYLYGAVSKVVKFIPWNVWNADLEVYQLMGGGEGTSILKVKKLALSVCLSFFHSIMAYMEVAFF